MSALPQGVESPADEAEDQESANREAQALRWARWANLFMGVAGIWAAIASNASALMLDGLFSGVNFAAAVVAGKVSQSIRRPPDVLRPFGYEIDEAVYVMFRSLVLVGIILLAVFNALGKVITYASGGEMLPIRLGWVSIYMAVMVVTCFSLAAWHHRNWLATGKRSALLKTERTSALIDGLLSAAAGLAFLSIAMLKNTRLAFLVPISDSLVVLGLASCVIWRPLSMFSQALREVVGEPADPETADRFATTIKRVVEQEPFRYLEGAVTRVGRSLFGVVYLQPHNAVEVHQLDEIRTKLLAACQAIFAPTRIRLEVFYTAKNPFSVTKSENNPPAEADED